MNFDFLKNYSWKEIQSEWYGLTESEKPTRVENGIEGTRIILESENESIEFSSFTEASFHMNCSPGTLRYHADNNSHFCGYKVYRK